MNLPIKINKLILIFLITCSNFCFAGVNPEIDSLKNYLKAAKEDTNKVLLLNKITISLGKISPDSALIYANESILLSKKLNFKKGEAYADYIIANIMFQRADYEGALSKYEDARLLFEITGTKSGLAEVYRDIGNCYILREKNNDALKYLLLALNLFNDLNDKLGSAKICLKISVIYKNQDNYDDAFKYCYYAIRSMEKTSNWKDLGSAYLILGLIYRQKGEYETAILNYKKAMEFYYKASDKTGIGKCYHNLGVVCYRQGNLKEALNNYTISLNICKELNDRKGAMLASGNLGAIYSDLHNYKEAMKIYASNLSMCLEVGSRKDISIAYSNIGAIALELNDYDEAEKNMLKALEYTSDNAEATNGCYHNLGTLNFKKRNYLKSHEYFLLAYKMNLKLDKKYEMAECLSSIGMVDNELKNYTNAIDTLIISNNLAKDHGFYTLLKDNYQLISEAYEGLMDTRNALAFYKLYKQTNDTLYNIEKSKQISEIQTRYETEKKDREIEKLNKENEIKALQAKEQQASLLAMKLETENEKNQITYLNQVNAFQELVVKKQKEALEKKLLETEMKRKEIKLLDNQKKLQEAEIGRRKWITNAQTMFFLLLLGLVTIGFYRFRQMQLQRQEAERSRIARDLHDDIGATLSSISIFSEAASRKLKSNNPEEAGNLLGRISTDALEMVNVMSDFVWTMNPVNDTIEKLTDRMQSFASIVLSAKNIQMNFETDENLKNYEMKPYERKNIFLIFKEAINNTAKYSGATIARVKLKIKNNKLEMVIEDNGQGFDVNQLSGGNGLINIKARADEIGAAITLHSGITGTCLSVTV